MGKLPRNPTQLLTQLPVDSISQHQLEKFTPELLLASKERRISLAIFNRVKKTKRRLLVFDFGATAAKAAIVTLSNGEISEQLVNQINIDNRGANYFPFLQNQLQDWQGPVAISVAGKVREGELEDNPNIQAFLDDLKRIGGFRRIINKINIVLNDAVACAVGGFWLAQKLPDAKNKGILLVINGGGIGGAGVMPDGQVYACEPGHIPANQSLDKRGVTGVCGFQGRNWVCLEQLGAMGKGVVGRWQQLIGEVLPAKKIAEKMFNGDHQALTLIRQAALITAIAYGGLFNAFANQGLDWRDFILVGHGGAFNIAGFPERVNQLLTSHFCLQESQPLLIPEKYNIKNLAMVGAALALACRGGENRTPI